MIRTMLVVLTLFALAACNGTPQSPSQAGKPGAPAADDGWKSLFDGKTLTGWKVPEFGGDGKVEVKDGLLHVGMGESCTGVTYTGPVLRDNYEVELEAQRVSGSDFFCALTFPVGQGAASLVLGGWGGGVVGISCIDGYDASDNETTQTTQFEEKQWYHVRVRVTKARLEAFLDDKQIVNVERGEKKFDVRIEVESNKPLGIATWRTHGALRNLRMRPVQPE